MYPSVLPGPSMAPGRKAFARTIVEPLIEIGES